jgi:hypothetical protein
MTAADIYPDRWAAGDFDDYLVPNLAKLRHFYRHAAARGEAVLLAIA